MESKIKILGHPVHQMLIVFPAGLLIMAGIFDALYFITGYAGLAVVSYWNVAAGVISGVIAAAFGLIDWIGIPRGTRAKRIGAWHATGNVVVLALFAASWLIRRSEAGYIPTPAAFIVEVVAVAIGGVTAWLGGELVDRLGVGVDPGAHLNAPSSLSGQPASSSAR
jgi:uncharacterized membrane protein